MNLDFHDKPDVFTLGDMPRGFLQVLLPGFTLTKVGESGLGTLIEISISDQLPAIQSSAGKKQFFEVVRKSRSGDRQLRRDLASFTQNDRVLSSRFDCGSHPLRYGNGGVLPVIRWSHADESGHDQVDEYFCLFYRDIFPIGWNIANGASDDVEELKNPEMILLREFGEELLIRDDENRIIYSFDPGRDSDPAASPSKARRAWEKTHPQIASFTTLSVPMTWFRGPDRVRVRWAGGVRESDGYFLNIVPDDNAIEVDRVALINVKGRICFFDGEQSGGVILNRAVGLFKVERFESGGELESSDLMPDLVFYDGVPGDPCALIGHVREKINELKGLASPFRTQKDLAAWESSARKLGLCPITRVMIQRYLDKSWSKPAMPARPAPSIRPRVTTQCDVFISYRSTDQAIAQGLHDYLESCGVSSFVSALSLPYLGESDYAAAIDRSLQSAECLVVLGTRPECFDSGWVGYEWRSFHNEKLSGRKPDSQLFTFVSDVSVDQLPFALRNYQMIPFSPSSLQDAFEALARYLLRALGDRDLRGI